MARSICIIGTSPLMVLIFYRLYKKYKITVFDYKDFIGGAWSYNSFKNINYSNFNNIIIPDTHNEDCAVNKINQELEKHSCKITAPIIPVKPKYNYEAKNIYLHDFSLFYETIKTEKAIVKEQINELFIENEKVVLNKKSFDFLFLPSCFKVENIYLNKKQINIESKIIKSSHLSVLFDKNDMPLCTYDDDFDNIFDRAQVREIDGNLIFTGRIRKEFKENNKNYFLRHSNFLNNYSNSISDSKLVYYHHDILNKDQLQIFSNSLANYPVSIVETKQLNHGYLFLEQSIQKLINIMSLQYE